MKFTLPKPNNLLRVGFLLMMIKVLFSASGILSYSTFADNTLSYLSAALLAAHILTGGYSRKTLIIYAFITAISLYSTIVTKQYGFLISIISCMALQQKIFDQSIRFIFQWETFFVVIHTIYAILNSAMTGTPLYGVYYGEVRYHFGFAHPNMFSIYLFNLILMWMWLNYDRINNKHLLLIFFISLVSQILTGTRTSFINAIVVLLIVWWLKRTKKCTMIQFIASWLVPGISILSFIACKMYTTGNSVILVADKILSARIKLGAYAYNHYGLSLLGQNITDATNITWDSFWQLNGFTFDCTYTYLMMNQGIIWLLLLSLGFYLLAKKGNQKIWVMIIAWSLYAVTEVHGINCFKCLPILLVSYLFHNWYRKGAQALHYGFRKTVGIFS